MTELVVVERGPDGTPRRPARSLVAAARRVTGETVKRIGHNEDGGWQADAWELTRLVGEQEFIINTKAGRVGAARLYAGKIDPDDPTGKPQMLEAGHPAVEILEGFGDTAVARAQLLQRMDVNLNVPGEGWWVGVPKQLLEEEKPTGLLDRFISPQGAPLDIEEVALKDLKWYMLSKSEVKKKSDTQVELTIEGRKITTGYKSIWLVRVWNPDPEYHEKATSPTRAVLPVLRELVGLTMHVSAQIDSRLAGAGAWLIPQSAVDAVVNQMENSPGPDDLDPFTDSLYEAGTTAIEDRSSASALMPVGLVVPDESLESANAWKHVTFSTPLDKEARQLREEAIRRLALGQDVPPEILLGVGGMNHWGAWLVREDTITTHVEPDLVTMCDALTTQYLWPLLEQQKVTDFKDIVIWYDVDHLVTRPNKLEDAIALHQAEVISDAALRDAGQFTDEDAKVDVGADEATSIVLKLITANPSLLRNPGTEALLESIRALVKGESSDQVEEPVDDAVVSEPEPDVTITEEVPPVER